MKNLKLLSILFLVSSIAITSCSKGTAGPAGPTGPTGPAGPDHVEHSNWIVLSTPFVGKDNNGDSLFQEVISAASITQAILDSGLVLSYLQFSDGSVVETSDYSSVLDVSYTLDSITVTGFNANFTNINFRYVVIPGTTTITSVLRRYTKQQLKTMSYGYVAKLLGISDKPGTN